MSSRGLFVQIFIKELFESPKKDNEVKEIILTDNGEKAFVAGAIIKKFSNYTPYKALKMTQFGQELFSKIENFPKPVVAAVNPTWKILYKSFLKKFKKNGIFCCIFLLFL